VKAWPARDQAVTWLLWAACAVMVLGAIFVLILPIRGENRVSAGVLPFGVSAAVLAAAALTPQAGKWLAALLYAAGGLAAAYGALVLAAIPLRLSIEGVCAHAPAPCPVGYGRPLSSVENLALGVGVACAILAVLIVFVAAEFRFQPRLTLFKPPKLPDDSPKTDS
jgi:hypothetical protein